LNAILNLKSRKYFDLLRIKLHLGESAHFFCHYPEIEQRCFDCGTKAAERGARPKLALSVFLPFFDCECKVRPERTTRQAAVPNKFCQFHSFFLQFFLAVWLAHVA
jgi:hypothetical protein